MTTISTTPARTRRRVIRTGRGGRGAALLLAFCGLLALSGCKGEQPPAASYTVRGELKGLPEAGARAEGDARVYIHHEAIPDFVDRQGERAGMMSMTMPFGLDEAISDQELAALSPGDAVEFTFAVHWDKNPPSRLRAIRALPAGTALELSDL